MKNFEKNDGLCRTVAEKIRIFEKVKSFEKNYGLMNDKGHAYNKVYVYFTYCFVSRDYYIDLLSIDMSNISAEVVAAWGEVSFKFFMFSLTSIGSRLTPL